MADLVDPSAIERIVGAYRHPTLHLGRAVDGEKVTYVLHPHECIDAITTRSSDLRLCAYSVALDRGLEPAIWEQFLDLPVVLGIDAEHGDLEPLRVWRANE